MGLMLEGLMKQAEEENARRKAQEEREQAERIERGKRIEAFRLTHTAARHELTLQEAIVLTELRIPDGTLLFNDPNCPPGLATFGSLLGMACEVFARVGLDMGTRRAVFGPTAHELLEARVGPCPCSECPFRK